MHGPTFMANALACAVSVASVEVLLGQDWRARVAEILRVSEDQCCQGQLLAALLLSRLLGRVGPSHPLVLRSGHPHFCSRQVSH